MTPSQLKLIFEVLNTPTAPFYEDRIVNLIERFVNERPLVYGVKKDRYGNLLVLRRTEKEKTGGVKGKGGGAKNKREKPARVLFNAHMDHPGFEAVRFLEKNLLELRFLGGVEPEYFKGAKIRLFPRGGEVVARIVEALLPEGQFNIQATAKLIGAKSAGKFPPGRSKDGVLDSVFGVWKLEPAELKQGLIHAPVCDDLIGLGAILCALEALGNEPAHSEYGALFTRAEEAGLYGAVSACKSALAGPRDMLLVCETSDKNRGGAIQGEGVIVRVGDSRSCFDRGANLILHHQARRLLMNEGVPFQRKLMDGGVCEASVYGAFGIPATGLSVALGNYHNRAPGSKIRREFVSVRDVEGMIRLLMECAKKPISFEDAADFERDAFDKRLARAEEKLLDRTADLKS